MLEAVARSADLQVSPEDLGREINNLAQVLGRDPKEVADSLDRSGQVVSLAGDIIRSKALDLLVDRADITSEGPDSTTLKEDTPAPESSSESASPQTHVEEGS